MTGVCQEEAKSKQMLKIDPLS